MAENSTLWTPPAGAATFVDSNPSGAAPSWTPPDGAASAVDLPPEAVQLLNDIRTKPAADLNAKGVVAAQALNTIGAENLSPDDINKLTELSEVHRAAPFNFSRAASAVTELPEMAAGIVKGAGGVLKRGATVLNPGASAQDREKATAELLAATEAGGTSTAGLVRQGVRKIGDLISGPPSHEESKNRLFEDAAALQQQGNITQGKGELAKTTGFDAETLAKEGIQLDPEAIGNMSNVTDPTMLVPFGAGFAAVSKVTGKVLFTAATREAAEAFTKSLGEKVISAGKGISDASKAAKYLRASDIGVAAGLLAHSVGVGGGAALAAKAIPYAGRALGSAVEGAGKVLTGEAGPVLRMGATAAKGAAAGAVSALPFAAAADNEEDAGRIVAGGGLFGAGGSLTHGALHTAYKAGQDVAQRTATKAFQEAAAAPPIKDTSVRTEPTWAAAHDESMQKLRAADPATANLVDRISTVLPAIVEASNPNAPMPELYVMDDANYQKTFAGTPAEKQSGFFDDKNNRLVVRFDGSDAEAIRHEPAHLIFDLMPEAQRKDVFGTIEKAYGEQGVKQFAQQYQDFFNKNLPPEQHRTFDMSKPDVRNYILTEIATEHLASILRGDRLDGTAPSVIRQLGEKATKMFELLGLYKPGIGGTPNKSTVSELGVGISPAVTEKLAPFFREKMQSLEVETALDPSKAPQWTPPANATFEDHPVATPQPGLATPTPARAPFEQPAPAPVEAGNPPTGLAVEPPNPENFGGFGHRSFVVPEELRAEQPVVERQTPSDFTQKDLSKADLIQKPENIRGVSDEQIKKLSTERDDMQIAQAAEAVKNATPHEQQVFSDILDSLKGSTRGNTPLLEVVHNSIKAEGDPNARQARRTEQEAGRAAEKNGSNEERVETTKRIVPTGFSVTEDGRAQLFGQSADKVLAAVNEGIVAQAEAHGIADKVPYDNHSGHLTPEGEAEFLQDLAAYTANQANGYRGDGKRLIRPANYDGTLPPENADFKPTSIDANRAQFLNMVVAGGELTYPKTNRVQKNSLTGVAIKPRNIAARELAEANAGVVLKPAKPGPKNQAFEDFGGTEIAEFNPLRQQFEKAGVDVRQKFIGAPEKINLADIKSVKALPGHAFQAPSIDMTRAGFMPRTDEAGVTEDQSAVDEAARRAGYTPAFRFHGSGDHFTEFTHEKSGATGGFFTKGAFFFSDSKDVASSYAPEGGEIKKVYLRLNNPLEMDFEGKGVWLKFISGAIRRAKAEGRDGVIFKNIRDSADQSPGNNEVVADTYAVFEPSQIKSAETITHDDSGAPIPLSRRFDTGQNDLRFMPRAETVGSADEVHNLSPDELVTAARNWKGGLTGQAIELGKRITPDELPVLESYRDEAHQKFGQYRAEKNLDGAMAEASRGQFFREAMEAHRASRGEEGLSIRPEDTVPRAFMPDTRGPVHREANEEVRDVADNYMNSIGREYKPDTSYVPVNVDLAKRIADYYDAAKNDPKNPEVKASYQALADETMAQYAAMKKAGVQIEPWEGKGEPYANSAEMIADVADNKHLWFFKTEHGFGEGEHRDASNPMLADSGVKIDGHELLVNDIFRAVHDYFGHVKEGNQFGPRGEFNAWRNHSEMFSDKAQGALAAETLAQNSWVNYGAQMRDENGGIRSNVPLAERAFAEQKAVVIPQELIDEAKSEGKHDLRFMPAITEAGKKLERERGFKIEHGGNVGLREVKIKARGKDIGETSAFREDDGTTASVGYSTVNPKYRGQGLGEVLYRELGAQLQKDGAKSLKGHLIAPQPLAIRRKVFGEPEVKINGIKTSVEDALKELNLTQAKRDAGWLETSSVVADNKITPDLRFMPKMEPQFVGKPLPNSVEEPVKVVHYTSREVKKVDPKFFGKAFANRNDLRGEPKSFFFEAGSPLGADKQFFGEGGKQAYGAVIDGSRLYDLSAGKPDPLGWNSKINRAEADEAVQDAGYKGIYIDTGEDDGRKVVLMFKPVKVEPLGDTKAGDVDLRKRDRTASDLSKAEIKPLKKTRQPLQESLQLGL